MYAMTIVLDPELLKEVDQHKSPNNAYLEIRRTLEEHDFIRQQQEGIYFGGSSVNAVTCVLAAQDLSDRFVWFARSVKNINMLRIEENNDLMPAIRRHQR